MKFNLFLCLTLLLVIGCQRLLVENKFGKVPKPSADFELLVKDGVWCWFSDPRAIYYRGEKEKFYFGFVNTKGDVLIGSKDVRSGAIETFILHDTLEIDDHNVPSILILPNGQLLAFYNEHNGHVFMRKSKYPEDIGAWEEEQIISEKTEDYSYTYTNPIRLSEENGRIYLMERKVGPTRSFEHRWQYLKYSDDNANTWSEELILLDNEGRKNPPYLKVTTDHRLRIDSGSDPNLFLPGMSPESLKLNTGNVFRMAVGKQLLLPEIPGRITSDLILYSTLRKINLSCYG